MTCPHADRADASDMDTPDGVTVELCRDCGATVTGQARTRWSLMSPVEVAERDDVTVVVRAVNGDTWELPAVLFDALYRPDRPATG